MFSKRVNGSDISVVLYVDDLMITSTSESLIQGFVKALERKYKTITVHEGRVHSYLGMQFDFSTAGEVAVTMDGYINDIIAEYDVKGSVASPATNSLFEVASDSPLLDSEGKDRFHSRVAKLLYLAKRVRPDLLTAIAFLSTRVQSPTEDDEKKLWRVLNFLNSSKDKQLLLKPDQGICVSAYVDASHAVHTERRSHWSGDPSRWSNSKFVCLQSRNWCLSPPRKLNSLLCPRHCQPYCGSGIS